MNGADIPVLISSAGRRGALVRLFQRAGSAIGQVVVHGCDMQPDLSAGCQIADHAHKVPRCSDPGFIDRIEEIVLRHGIRLIVPTIDTELAAYAGAAARLAEAGAHVHVSPSAVIAAVRDKLATMQLLGKAGVSVPDSCTEEDLRADPSRLGWPVFGKPVGGSASRGLAVYHNPDQLPDRFAEPMMFQPVLSGAEYTVNIFIDRNHQLRCVVPHLRIQTRAGEVEKGRTERRADLRKLAEGIHAALPDACGVLCFQVIDDPKHGPSVIEINARFGGGYPLAHHAGANFADWLIQEVAGKPCGANDDWRDAVTMLRYDDAVFAG